MSTGSSDYWGILQRETRRFKKFTLNIVPHSQKDEVKENILFFFFPLQLAISIWLSWTSREPFLLHEKGTTNSTVAGLRAVFVEVTKSTATTQGNQRGYSPLKCNLSSLFCKKKKHKHCFFWLQWTYSCWQLLSFWPAVFNCLIFWIREVHRWSQTTKLSLPF